VSLLQRKLGIGYGRAARIIDQMAEDGLVGDYKGSQARECLITLEEWEAARAEHREPDPRVLEPVEEETDT
jgi:S-DNA-T family DNA segregation ATPase FtsK/SpoIIIE